MVGSVAVVVAVVVVVVVEVVVSTVVGVGVVKLAGTGGLGPLKSKGDEPTNCKLPTWCHETFSSERLALGDALATVTKTVVYRGQNIR